MKSWPVRFALGLLVAAVLAFTALPFLLPTPAQGQPASEALLVASEVSTNTTISLASPGKWKRINVWFYVTDDGDGGSVTYALQYCPTYLAASCQAFSPAITGTLTVGGTAVATAFLENPPHALQIVLSSNTALASIEMERLP